MLKIKSLKEVPRLLVPGSRSKLWQKTGPKREKKKKKERKDWKEVQLLPHFVFCFLRSFCFLFFPLRGNGVRRPPLRPHPAGPPLHGVRRGILRARRSDGGAGRGPPPTVPARGLLPSPHRPPRHHRIVLERRGLPVSGKCPGPSRNQPVDRGSPLPAGGECGKPAEGECD